MGTAYADTGGLDLGQVSVNVTSSIQSLAKLVFCDVLCAGYGVCCWSGI